MPAEKPSPERLAAIEAIQGPSAPPPVSEARTGADAPPLRWREEAGPNAPPPQDELRITEDPIPTEGDLWTRLQNLGRRDGVRWEEGGEHEDSKWETEDDPDLDPEPIVYSYGDGFTNTPIIGRKPKRRWTGLTVNLLIARITSCLMFIVGIIILAFAGVMKEDLQHDDGDYTCEEDYIAEAATPWNEYDMTSPGRYHSDCRLLLTWSYIIIVSGSISLFRALLQAVAVGGPSTWSVQYPSGGTMDHLSSTTNIYLIRTFFSFVPFVLYSVGAVILGTSRLITGPPAWDSYRNMYVICLSIIVVSAVASLHQFMTTGIASWKLRGGKTRFARG